MLLCHALLFPTRRTHKAHSDMQGGKKGSIVKLTLSLYHYASLIYIRSVHTRFCRISQGSPYIQIYDFPLALFWLRKNR